MDSAQNKALSHHSRALSQYASIQNDVSSAIKDQSKSSMIAKTAMKEINPHYKDVEINQNWSEEASSDDKEIDHKNNKNEHKDDS